MKDLAKARSHRIWLMASVSAMMLAGPAAYAQDGDDAASAADDERIVVTGSRLRRDEFNSISPLQVIDAELARQVGIVDTSEMITQATTAAGTQLDATFSGGSGTAVLEDVPANGLGGATIQLRGLEPERTLVLLNGRRLAPAGVRGAPTQPDLNNIPSSIISSIEILTDGASSVYGADAVAGVVNIITRDDFDGLEFTGFGAFPNDDGGVVQQYSMIAGSDFAGGRGHAVFTAEYFDRERIATGERDWAFCRRDVERTASGQIVEGPCDDSLPDAAAVALGINQPAFLFWVPDSFGPTSTGVPNFENASQIPFGAIPAGSGDASLNDFYNVQDERRDADLVQPLRRISVYTAGEYNVDIISENDTIFWEFSYTDRQQSLKAANEQIFPGVPALIPMENDQGALILCDGLLSPGCDVGGAPRAAGSLALFANPINPYAQTAIDLGLSQLDSLPVFTSEDFNQKREVEVEQYRLVGGIRGDLFDSADLGFTTMSDWTYEFYANYSRSQGHSSQPGMNEQNLAVMLDTMRLDSSGDVVCGAVDPDGRLDFGFLAGQVDCVVVPWFSERFMNDTTGERRFTDEERQYLIGLRTNRTVIDQQVFSLFFTGDAFELPAGSVPLGIGFEYRKESIDTFNDMLTTNFMLASESANEEGNTVGVTDFIEAFVETELPIFRNQPWAEDLTVNLAGRWTEERNFGAHATWSVKAGYAPVEYLTFRGTYGTSFRAPNLREQFLAPLARSESQAGDPCKVPAAAIGNTGGANFYIPGLDTRSPTILTNCIADGIDPTLMGIDATANFSVFDGGADGLEPETSTSWTVGANFQQPWWEDFSLDFSLTWFNIDIDNTVENLGSDSILNQCYAFTSRSTSSCARITREFTGDPRTSGLLREIEAGFINIGVLTAEGLDLNARFFTDVEFLGENFEITVVSANTYMSSQTIQVLPDDPIQDNVGLIGTPEWRSTNNLLVGWENLTFSWRSRLIGNVSAEGFVGADAPSGPTLLDPATGLPFCPACVASVGAIPNYWIHDASLTGDFESWRLRFGIRNLFDRDPPVIDDGFNGTTLPGQIFSNRNNSVTAGGYDFVGRTYFANVTKKF